MREVSGCAAVSGVGGEGGGKSRKWSGRLDETNARADIRVLYGTLEKQYDPRDTDR